MGGGGWQGVGLIRGVQAESEQRRHQITAPTWTVAVATPPFTPTHKCLQQGPLLMWDSLVAQLLLFDHQVGAPPLQRVPLLVGSRNLSIALL